MVPDTNQKEDTRLTMTTVDDCQQMIIKWKKWEINQNMTKIWMKKIKCKDKDNIYFSFTKETLFI